MKHLKRFNESLVDKKIQLLKDLSLELEDAGLEVQVKNGVSYLASEYRNSIVMLVTDPNRKFSTDLYNTEIINEFKETLKSYGMNPRTMFGGGNCVVFGFDKWGRMTNSPVIRE